MYVKQIHKRDGMARMETNEKFLKWLENLDEDEIDHKKSSQPMSLPAKNCTTPRTRSTSRQLGQVQDCSLRVQASAKLYHHL